MQQATASGRPTYPWLASYPLDVDWGAEIDVKPLHALLEDAVARFPDRPCIDFLDRRYSFAEDVGRLANRAAKGFQALGVGPGVKVGLHLPNTPLFRDLLLRGAEGGRDGGQFQPPLHRPASSAIRSRIPRPTSW